MRSRRAALKAKSNENPPKITQGPSKSEVTNRYYQRRVIKKMITKIDDDIYQFYLSPTALSQHFEWMDEGWAKAMKALEIKNARKAKAAKAAKKAVQRSKKIIRGRWNSTTFKEGAPKPSLVFSNSILSGFITNINKTSSNIVKYTQRISEQKLDGTKSRVDLNKKIQDLNKLMIKLITYYSEFVETYLAINGVTKNLIKSLIQAHNLSYVNLLYKISKIDGNDEIFLTDYLNANIVNKEAYDYFITNEIPVDRNIVIYLRNATEEDQLQNFTQKFSSDEICNNLDEIIYPSVRFQLIKDGTIKFSKKMVQTQLKGMNIELIHALIESGKYSPTIMDINNIFKPKITKKAKTNRRRYYWRQLPTYNTKLSTKVDEIDRLIRILIDKNIKVPFSKPTIDYIFAHSNVSLLCVILNSQNKPDYPYDKKWEHVRESVSLNRYRRHRSNNFITTIIEHDDIESFRTLIDMNLLPVASLHEENSYLIKVIAKGADKIATYMMNELHVKLFNWNCRSLWGWRLQKKPETKIIKDIQFMKNHGIPLNNSLIGDLLSNHKYKAVTYAVDKLGLHLDKSHVRYLKDMSVKEFNNYANKMNIDKIKMLASLARGSSNTNVTSWWYRQEKKKQLKKNAIVTNVVAKQPLSERKNLAKKIGKVALNNNNTELFETLKKRYNFDINVQDVKTIVNHASYKCTDNKFIANIKKYHPGIIEQLKNEDNAFKIKMTTKSLTKENMNFACAKNIIDIGVIPNEELIMNLIDITSVDNGAWWRRREGISSENQTFLSKVIRLLPEYKNQEVDKLYNIVMKLIQKGCIATLNALSNKNYNPFSVLTLREVYSSCLQLIAEFRNTKHAFDLLISYKKVKNLTPFMWTILKIAINYAERENHWYNIRPSTNQLIKLISVQSSITKDDREFFTSVKSKKKTNLKFKTVKYEQTDDETPDNLDFYVRAIANAQMLAENDLDSDDLEMALNNVEAELIDELGDDINMMRINVFDEEEGEWVAIGGENQENININYR